MNEITLNAYLTAIDSLDRTQCMVFNHLCSDLVVGEKQGVEGEYSGTVSTLANDINLLTPEDREELFVYLEENLLKKRVGGRPCEAR